MLAYKQWLQIVSYHSIEKISTGKEVGIEYEQLMILTQNKLNVLHDILHVSTVTIKTKQNKTTITTKT